MIHPVWGPRVPLDGVIAWGHRPSARKALNFANNQNIRKFYRLEDGFLRSLSLGVSGSQPLSLVMDDLGIYYDSTWPSRLEELIAKGPREHDLLENARRGISLIRRHRLSKYNQGRMFFLPYSRAASRVLVVDQTAGDMSVALGGATGTTFDVMLAAALSENPGAEIWIKTHPDVLTGKKRGYLDVQALGQRLHMLAQDCCPLTLIEQFDRVYVVTSQMGFEALMLGKPVTCFGQPWYAGWGLTDDRHPDMASLHRRRPASRTVEQLFAAAYLQYARYINPATGKLATLFDVIDWMGRNKAISNEIHGTLYCVGMSRWKRAIAAPFLQAPSSRLRFVRSMKMHELEKLPSDARIVVWGSREALLCEAAADRGISVIRLEDGFIRSSGLGSDLHAPLSLAVDDLGIYYDPTSGSKLELLLNTYCLADDERSRARSLLERLVRLKISKYNVGVPFGLSSDARRHRVLLVPGQVEDDASIRAGSPMVFRNRDLLAAVRKENPHAWIIYKPHPDVVAGNRKGRISEVDLALLADEVVPEANISDCIAAVDEIHTMTSQAGFEALLFGKVVHCYGAPFYAGWGLTVDHMPLPHRKRRLSIEALVFVALCQYPRYRLPGVDGFCAVEDVIDYLVADQRRSGKRVGSHWLGRQWRKARQLVNVFAMAR
ncbi:capsular polysaccharide biosynthesis protein [Cupriavidus oxalaticus]|uniref:Capsular polysaccharide biosynthesis protein n=2 Tax=Cupriavidus oxalaticus TaxID=96344 RepID=A0A5P3VJP2_9BURK|nr:capsular polysaccharide biosynthesis protein [Cupriavidus oxalaticus]